MTAPSEPQSFDIGTALVPVLPNLRAFAISICGDSVRADDLVQETVLKAIEHGDKFEPGTNLSAWLFTILRNTFRSQWRRAWRNVEDPEGEIAGNFSVPEEQSYSVAYSELMQRMAGIPHDMRKAVMLIGYEGRTYEEAAEILGIAVGTVKSRVNRAREMLFTGGSELSRSAAAAVFSSDERDTEIASLWRQQKSIDEICAALSSSRIEVMQVIATLDLTGNKRKVAV